MEMDLGFVDTDSDSEVAETLDFDAANCSDVMKRLSSRELSCHMETC